MDDGGCSTGSAGVGTCEEVWIGEGRREMDGKRYLYSAPVVDVKIAAPPRASRDGDKQQKEHTLLSRRAGRVNPRDPPDRPRPNPTPKENPIEQVSRRRFCCFFRWCAVCSWVGWRRGRRARGSAANQRGPYQIQQAGRGSPAGFGGSGGLAKSRGVERGLELEKLAQIDAAVSQGADGELGRELGPLMREFVQC